MIDFKKLASGFRRVADAYDELNLLHGTGTSPVVRNVNAPVRTKKRLHWTQRPENALKVKSILRKASRARNAK